MDRSSKQLPPTGLCHRLFCFMFKAFAAQAIKTVTLGSRVANGQSRSLETGKRAKSIDEETCALLDNRGEGCREGTRKTVSIKDEPEIISNRNKKRRPNSSMKGRRYNGDVRPLRSILKVGSNLRDT
ncbi:hypothetical protein vseg_021444 [Gypsophila vaccaria]